jgi:uncharacterized SAM-binding protein YcdF (DUF218 family)
MPVSTTVRHLIKRILLPLLFVAVVLWLLAHAASFLIVDAPKKSDVILVLANDGDKDRFLHAVELLKQGYAQHILLDVEGKATVYDTLEVDLARKFVERVLPAQTSICETFGDSTYEEAAEAKNCLDQVDGSSVLVVTSDYHTRRAFSIFSKRLPKHEVSIAAARDERWFSTAWWKRRRWAKTTLEEWQKLMWWELVDRWHRGVVVE